MQNLVSVSDKKKKKSSETRHFKYFWISGSLSCRAACSSATPVWSAWLSKLISSACVLLHAQLGLLVPVDKTWPPREGHSVSLLQKPKLPNLCKGSHKDNTAHLQFPLMSQFFFFLSFSLFYCKWKQFCLWDVFCSCVVTFCVTRCCCKEDCCYVAKEKRTRLFPCGPEHAGASRSCRTDLRAGRQMVGVTQGNG